VQYAWRKRNAYRTLMGEPEGRTSIGRARLRREDNIKMYFKEIVRGDIF
jgi:hypothetical protein